MVPLLAVSSPQAATPAAAPVRAAAAAEDIGRIAFAGTEHRSIGRVTGTPATAEPLLGPGPAHYDTEAYARGDQVVFTSLRDGTRPQVYLRDGAGGIRKLTSDRDAANPELTPDGRFVVFDSAEPRLLGGTQRDLWIVGTDGTGERRLTETPQNETAPTVSPEGARVAYASDADPLRGRQIYARQLGGGTPVRISDGPAGDADDPAWNPVDDAVNRDLVAYTLTLAPGGAESGPRLRVTQGQGADGPLLSGEQATWQTRAAAWQPDGDTILFLSINGPCGCTNPYDTVYRAVAHSTVTASVVLYEDRRVDSPTWLGPQDGGSVLVTRTTPEAKNHAHLMDVKPDGSDPRDLGFKVLWEDPKALTNTDPAADPLFNPSADYDPWTERQNYTPDGRRIVVTRFHGDPKSRIEDIYLTDADGSKAAPLPLAGGGAKDWDTDPTFSPDGKLIAFTRTSPGGVGSASGPGRILIADATTGALVDEVRPPAGQTGGDAQPTWSSDGTTLAFTRNHVIGGVGGNKHIWTVPVKSLGQQRDLSAELCPGSCQVIDDSPAFSPDGKRLAFNRKDGGGRLNERNSVLMTDLADGRCQVLLPTGRAGDPDGCRQEVPDTSATGPFQPRDVAWSPDATRLVFSSRRALAANSPEALSTVEVATGAVTTLTGALPGRQKEPAYQQSVNLTVTAPPTAEPVTEGETGTVTVTVTNQGPSAAPGTTFTAAVPPGVRLDGMTPSKGVCEAGSPQCELGVLEPRESVTVTVRLTGVTPGETAIDWSVTGAVIDRAPADNATRTLVPVENAPEPPTPTPTTPTPTPTTPTPTPPKPTPPPPAPKAGPALTITARPEPGYVGGRVVLTYTVRNGREALATGLNLRLGLPKGIPAGKAPAGCVKNVCALGDLAPGASTVVTIVLSPNKALTTTATGRITTSGTDADPKDNTDRQRIRILQPKIIAVPAIGKPGFVTSVRGKDFPPGTPVTLTWKPGITAAAVPTIPKADGTFIAQLLILHKDQTGPRVITAKGAGFSPVTTPFLVVTGNVAPPDEVARR
ncbi:hypothetical protein Q5762_16275 [Streptomyces sp. P9(2023)]|nr:hypothetical protein [Streptomyces sp. P9(2023)]MDT9689868.1 hypothetical protein [Streptomyces sp. P9(2023)]